MIKKHTQESSPIESAEALAKPPEEAISSRLLTVAERAAIGRAARAKVPRSAQAAWNPPSDRPDPVALLEAQAATRIPELIPIRYRRMLISPFAFYRGAAAIMASDLAATPDSGLITQLCGDAHLANFGGFASPERDIVFDINDFDETLPGPWEWDVKRLAASFEVAGRQRGFTSPQTRAIVLACAGEYRRTMREFAGMPNLDVWYTLLDGARIKARWGVASQARDVKKVETELTLAHAGDNLRVFEKLTECVDNQLRIVSHPPLVVPIEKLLPEQISRRQAEQIVQNYITAYRKTLPDDLRRLHEQFHYLHMARKVVGVGSVGTRAWVILLAGRDEDDLLFLQYKEAQASVLEPYARKSRFADHGRRVVEGQHLMQAASDIFLGWERVQEQMDGQLHDYYVRQLWDWKLSADIETMSADELKIYAEMCGWTLARAHARAGDRIAIAAYLGKSDAFDQALAAFAAAYADQNQRDFRALEKAVKNGRVKAEIGV